MIYRSPKLLKHAKDQCCVSCGSFHGVVAAHLNEGKGMGMKVADCLHAHLCHVCHAWFDQGARLDPTGIWTEKREFGNEMFKRTIVRLFTCGYVRVV